MTTEEEDDMEELQDEDGEEERSMKLCRIGGGGGGGPDGRLPWKGSSMAKTQRPNNTEGAATLSKNFVFYLDVFVQENVSRKMS